MKKYIIFIIVVIFSVFCVGELAIGKTKKKTTKKHTKKKIISLYDNNPYDLDTKKLPIKYVGHNLNVVFLLADAEKEAMTKDEYQTKEEHKELIESLLKVPFYNNIKITDPLCCVTKVDETVYDADNKSLGIKIKAYNTVEKNITIRNRLSIRSALFSTSNESKYKSQNAFGVKVLVESYNFDIIALSFSNYNNEIIIEEDYQKKMIFYINNLSPETAKKVRKDIVVGFVFTLEHPYTSMGVNYLEATIDDPVEIIENYNNILCNILKVIIFRYSTGEILSTYDFTKAS